MKTTKTFAAAALALAAVLPMTAANASEPRSVSISYADLNLASEAGQAILDRRIDNAIEAVCGRLEGKPTFDSAVRRCQQNAREQAMQSRDLAVANYASDQLARSESREIRFVVR